MAKDLLDAICAAEDEAKTREEKANELAAEKAKQANTDAAALIESRRKAAEQKASEKLEAAAAEFEQENKQAREDAEKQCEKVGGLADKNREAVIKHAAELLLS